MENNIYKLSLHESLEVKCSGDAYKNYMVTRVDGGWLYSWRGTNGEATETFVPERPKQ